MDPASARRRHPGSGFVAGPPAATGLLALVLAVAVAFGLGLAASTSVASAAPASGRHARHLRHGAICHRGSARRHSSRHSRCRTVCKRHRRCKSSRKTHKTPSVSAQTRAPVPATPAIDASTPTKGTPSPPATGLRLFSSTSVFNHQLPLSVPLASNSAQLVSNFSSQVSRYQGHVVINTTSWSTPVYVVGAGAPTTALVGHSSICPRPEGVFSGFQAQIEAVPIPANALPAAGSDKEVIVWQPSTGHLWELWRVLEESGHWTACWGGEIADAYTSEGVLPAPFGAGASGLSLLGGQIHLEDLEHGTIDHALEILMPDTANKRFVWPADRTDGTSTAGDSIPEGTHFRLNPHLDLSALHLSPSALAIATAIQRYGLLVGDTAGAVALSAQDPTPIIRDGKPNPYNTLLSNPYEALNAIPWGQLETVSPSYRG
jgi:hypothetical protein